MLVVANRAGTMPSLLREVRRRGALDPVVFHLLVPYPGADPAGRSWLGHPDCSEGGQVLALALPLLQHVSGCPFEGSVSVQQDPIAVVEEAMAQIAFTQVHTTHVRATVSPVASPPSLPSGAGQTP